MEDTDVKSDAEKQPPARGASDGAEPEKDRTARPGHESGADADPAVAGDPRPGPLESDEPDYKDRWLRAEAELQNFRRRAVRDREETQRFVEERYLLEVISLLDDLERALEATGEDVPNAWSQGVRLVANRMSEFLARQGVTPIAALSKPFDPEFHEALMEVDAPAGVAPGDVVHEIRKGYQRGGRALRATHVAVARRAPHDEDGAAHE